MKRKNKIDRIDTLGIDLAKNHFQVHGLDKYQKAVLTKSFTRKKLIEFIVNLNPCKIGMEACGGSNYLAQLFTDFGHNVKLIAPQYVKPFVKGNKNDSADAEAICIALTRPEMRFVAIKKPCHQDIQSLHRIRSRLVKNRTALMNETRGLLKEYGIEIDLGVEKLKQKIVELLKSSDSKLSPLAQSFTQDLYSELLLLEEQIENYDKKLEKIQKNNLDCKRLNSIRGIGLICSTILIVALADPRIFKNGRQFAAWLGLVPRHCGTGGKNTNLGISKRGDSYIRCNMIHGARSALLSVIKKVKHEHVLDPLENWIYRIYLKHGFNKSSVALANKNARIAWALIKNETEFIADKAAYPKKKQEIAA